MSQKSLVIMVGSPASGKSTVRQSMFPHMQVVDCDDIKASHPDYDPKNPQKFHEWSRKVVEELLVRKVADGESFVYDGTGSSVDRYSSLIDNAHRNGYKVLMVHVIVSLATAIERNANRERVVPEAVVVKKYTQVANAANLLKSLVDELVVVNNE